MTPSSSAPEPGTTRSVPQPFPAPGSAAAAPRDAPPPTAVEPPPSAPSGPVDPASPDAPSGPVDPTRLDPTVPVSPHGPSAHRADPPPRPSRGSRVRRALGWTGVVVLVLLIGGVSALGVHLYRTSQAWEERSQTYLEASEGLGAELAASRAELAGNQAELEAVRGQLATARARIVELADEKARLGDDRAVQLQLVDYQLRVSEAAGKVALALDQCVKGQDQLIGYLRNSAAYDPAELDQYGKDVQALCETASEANDALQIELSR